MSEGDGGMLENDITTIFKDKTFIQESIKILMTNSVQHIYLLCSIWAGKALYILRGSRRGFRGGPGGCIRDRC
jgi:hypothetical protein